VLCMLLCLAGVGCSWVKKPAEESLGALSSLLAPGNKGSFNPVDLQEDLLRYADNLASVALSAVDSLQKNGKPLDPAEQLSLRVILGWGILTAATGANALGNLVELMILTSTGRMRIEEYYVPKVYGSSATKMLEAFRGPERAIWQLGKQVLRTEQQDELKAALEQWRRKRAREANPLAVFASISLVEEVTKAARQESAPRASSVFALLDLDPLAGLDPATRELAQTRLFAERALFIGQRMPQLLQWQTELVMLHAARIPEVQQLVANTDQLAASGDRLTRLLEQTPALISSEREQLVAALRTQQQGLAALAKELGITLAQGTRMADATNAALKTFQGVTKQFKSGSPEPKDTSSEPFRIKDYAETAAEIARMSKQLKELLDALQPNLNPNTLAALSAQADAVAARTQARGTALVEHTYRLALQLVALTALIVLGTALVYRAASTRIVRPGTPG